MTFSVLFSRQLCLLLNAENIFHSMADILLREEDLKFASTMVHTLNTILLTSTELFQLRNQLKDLKTLVLPLTPVLGLWVHRHAAHSSTDPRRPRGVNWESSLSQVGSTCSSQFLPHLSLSLWKQACWFWDLCSAKSLLTVKIEVLLENKGLIALLVFLLALAPLPQLDTSVS